VLSRYLDALVVRTFAEEKLLEMARWATIPVINGLTDLTHPCQVLTDVFTAEERLGVAIENLTVAWIGDGNNMANSWINAAWRLGFQLRPPAPRATIPTQRLARAQRETDQAVRDPRSVAWYVVNTDVWASMGQEEEHAERSEAFTHYTVDASLMRRAAPQAIFMHCLPAHRGEEVTPEVIDGPQSRVWDEAENRLHIQKAIMAVLMGGEALA
jgi:ornithine carbamoyltransferase